MKLTIIRDDNSVLKDGVNYNHLNLSVVPSNINALHWDDATSTGEIEYTDGSPNEDIYALPDWANTASSKWDEAKAVEEQDAADYEAYLNSPDGKLETIRTKRNELLAETDWWASSDLTMTDKQIAYRQALRDITNTYNDPATVVWPDKPEWTQ